MTEQPKLTWKGRLIAFGVSAVLCIALIEGVSRYVESRSRGLAVLPVEPHPYLMNVGVRAANMTWRNIFTDADVPSRMAFNNLGFTVDGDFGVAPNEEFSRKYVKGPKDKIVLITGGSVVHGVGATANSKTTAGQLEAILNEKQSTYRYRVVNLGNAGWIAYQQFIALSLFGMPLKPDWIVVMDGHNDANIACPHGGGAGNPLSWPVMLHLFAHSRDLSPRSPVMEWMIRNVAAARIATGAKPADGEDQAADRRNNKERDFTRQLYLDESELDGHFKIKMRNLTMKVLDEQLKFYLLAEQNVKELFSTANVLLSSQPYYYNNAISPWYRKAFDFRATAAETQVARQHLQSDLDAYIARAADTKCSHSVAGQALGYFSARAALELEKTVARWVTQSRTRSILFANTEMVLPPEPEQRQPNFIDNAHMSDLGQRRIAGFFAGEILERDLGTPFDPAAYVEEVYAEAARQQDLPAVAFQYSPPPQPSTATTAGKPVTEGVTVTERSPGALQIAESPEIGYHRITWTGLAAVPGRNNTMTVDVWADRSTNVRIEMVDSNKSYGRAEFELLHLKTLVTDGKDVVSQIKDLGGGWRRLALTLPVTANTVLFTVSLLSFDREISYPGGNKALVVTEPTAETVVDLERAAAAFTYSPPPGHSSGRTEGQRQLEGVEATERSPGAWQLTANSGAGFHRILWSNLPTVAGKTNTVSVKVWTKYPAKVQLEMVDTAKAYGRADFDVLTLRTLFTSGKHVAGEVEDLGGGWKRLALTMPVTADRATFNVAMLSPGGEIKHPGNNQELVVTEPTVNAQ